jgi:Domain of Unknown Function (DUF1259)
MLWRSVQSALGGSGREQPGGILRFGLPRTDLHVTVGGLLIRPTLALGTWLAFLHTTGDADHDTMLMGDLVLTEDEVNPVMLALQQGGVQQTALHNHVLHESPRVLYMHIAAHGNAAAIARTLRAALALTQTPIPAGGAPNVAVAPAAPFELDTAMIARTLGASGRIAGGVYQVSVPRAAPVMEHGQIVPPSMGVATAINFQPTGNGVAAITGDFVVTADEVNPVIQALREHAILVTAIHSHMLYETPRLFFMHFWAVGNAATLADGLRAALDRTAVRR